MTYSAYFAYFVFCLIERLFMTMDLSLQKPNEPVREITNNLGSDQVRLKPGYTVIENGQRLEILDLESRGIVLSE